MQCYLIIKKIKKKKIKLKLKKKSLNGKKKDQNELDREELLWPFVVIYLKH
jgi:hypothetical protein